MAINLATIIRNIDWGRQERAEYVRLVSVKYGRSRQTGQPKGVAKAFSRREGSDATNRYTCVVNCLDGASNVSVSCSCPDFCFKWEYALHKHGAADIIYSTGQPAATTNPGNKPGVCKHVFYLISQLVKSNKLHPRGLVFYDARKDLPKAKPLKSALPPVKHSKAPSKNKAVKK